MNSNSGDQLWRQLCNQNGYRFVNVPIDTSRGPALVTISNDTTMTCVDTLQNNVYQMRSSMANPPRSNGVSNVSTNSIVQRPPQPASIFRDGPVPESGMLVTSSSLHQRRSPDEMDTDANTNAMPSSNSSHNPRTLFRRARASNMVVGGLDIIAASELISEMVETPTRFDADTQFYDALYLSLQEDVSPLGASPLDGYLNQKRDARVRIFLDAAIDNQGCGCERSALDAYLEQRKDHVAAMALRATLSEECKQRMPQPSNTTSVQRQVATMRGALDNLYRQLQQSSDPDAAPGSNVWNSYNQSEEWAVIG